MITDSKLRDQTISDFGDQWGRFTDNQGWYGSTELFEDIVTPLLEVKCLDGAKVAEIGSGTGRIVGMLLDTGVDHVYAIEPSSEAFRSLSQNVQRMPRQDHVTAINKRGDDWRTSKELDYVFSIGVIHHIPDPRPVLQNAFSALHPGGRLFLWLYGYEGNEFYVRTVGLLRTLTTRVPHFCLNIIVELMYFLLVCYRHVSKIRRLPLHDYIENVLWPISPQKRKLVIYDQLNPAYAKYYRKDEAVQLLRSAGFVDIRIHHRHGYSWSIMGCKPAV